MDGMKTTKKKVDEGHPVSRGEKIRPTGKNSKQKGKKARARKEK